MRTLIKIIVLTLILKNRNKRHILQKYYIYIKFSIQFEKKDKISYNINSNCVTGKGEIIWQKQM